MLIVRVLRRKTPFAVLTGGRKVESVVQWAFDKLHGHVFPVKTGIDFLTYIYVPIPATTHPSPIIGDVSRLIRVGNVSGIFHVECEHLIAGSEKAAFGIGDGDVDGNCGVHRKGYRCRKPAEVVTFIVGDKGGVHSRPNIVRNRTGVQTGTDSCWPVGIFVPILTPATPPWVSIIVICLGCHSRVCMDNTGVGCGDHVKRCR